MNKQNFLTEKNQTIILLFISALMIFVSVYLTQHFFEVRYPEGLSEGSICNISDFFSCDKITNSKMAAPFNIPTSIFGGVIGLFILIGAFYKSSKYQNSLYLVLAVNFVGCVGLFLYSLIFINSICLFCLLYYVLSTLALFIYYRKNLQPKPDYFSLRFMIVVVVLSAIGARATVNFKDAKIAKTDSLLKESVMSDLKQLEKVNFDNSQAPYKINAVPGAPLQMAIFSDFECPACRALSEQIPEILVNFKDKIDISYYFYPLDQACNPSVKRVMHQHACKAASAVICSPQEKFFELHDMMFNNQSDFGRGFVDRYIQQYNLETCVNGAATQDRLKKIIQMADPVGVHSTPTFVLNGYKFEGAVPFYKLKIIMDTLANQSSK